jgi:hypothetical protein
VARCGLSSVGRQTAVQRCARHAQAAGAAAVQVVGNGMWRLPNSRQQMMTQVRFELCTRSTLGAMQCMDCHTCMCTPHALADWSALLQSPGQLLT